jgi:hypothetical protein
MAATGRAALYLRVSTGRQADNDLSIPDQRRQAASYCASRGWEIVADYVEPGATATDDRRPEFQCMIDAAMTKPPTFDVIVVHSPALKDPITELKVIRDQVRADAERAAGAHDRTGPAITSQSLKTFAREARKRLRSDSGGYRRDYLRALTQRIEVDAHELRIMGVKSELLCTLAAAAGAKTAGFGVPSSVPKWGDLRGSNPS